MSLDIDRFFENDNRDAKIRNMMVSLRDPLEMNYALEVGNLSLRHSTTLLTP